MARKMFRPTKLDLALAADPVAEAARLALSVAAGEVPAPSPASPMQPATKPKQKPLLNKLKIWEN